MREAPGTCLLQHASPAVMLAAPPLPGSVIKLAFYFANSFWHVKNGSDENKLLALIKLAKTFCEESVFYHA